MTTKRYRYVERGDGAAGESADPPAWRTGSRDADERQNADTQSRRFEGASVTVALTEIAELCGVSKPTARSMLTRHGITTIRNSEGRNAKRWYAKAEVEDLLRRQGIL